MMIRDAADDVVLHNVGPNNDEDLPLKRGTRVVVDLIGIRMYPRRISDELTWDHGWPRRRLQPEILPRT